MLAFTVFKVIVIVLNKNLNILLILFSNYILLLHDLTHLTPRFVDRHFLNGNRSFIRREAYMMDKREK